LHSKFTWDDTKAAQEYRLWQARHLIQVYVKVVAVDGANVETRVYVSLNDDQNAGGGYRTLVSVLSDDNMREQLLSEAVEDMQRFKQKYAALKELAEIFAAMTRVEKNQYKNKV
jgi:hypothetical protein